MNGELRRLMAGKPKATRKKPGTKSHYQDPGFKAALKAVWQETEYMCSKNLKKAMPVWLPAYEAVDGVFREGIRAKLLSISAASIDRVLQPYKHLSRGRCRAQCCNERARQRSAGFNCYAPKHTQHLLANQLNS
jgi:hypothetical protein